ncbi:MAG: acyl carrier protein [Planctomycetota bacterium]|jgi:acyl carrier protein
MDTEQKIRSVLAEILSVEPDAITDAFGPADAPLWDSLNALRIVTELESAFSIRLAMADIPQMSSFAAIRDTVDRYRAAS